MTRLAGAVDRLAAFIAGVALVGLGVALLLWNTDVVEQFPETVTAPGLVSATDMAWWPWALAGAGLVCAFLAVRWLFSHTPASSAGTLRLADPDGLGRVSIDLGSLADAAAAHLAARPDVTAARGKAVVERGVRTIELTVTARSVDDLATLVETADEVSADLARSLGDPSVAVRSLLGLERGRGGGRSARHLR